MHFELYRILQSRKPSNGSMFKILVLNYVYLFILTVVRTLNAYKISDINLEASIMCTLPLNIAQWILFRNYSINDISSVNNIYHNK